MFNATFLRHEPGNYGGKLVFLTDKGDWKMDNNLPQGSSLPAPNTPVSIDAQKVGNYWKCKAIHTATGGPPPAQTLTQTLTSNTQQPTSYDAKDLHIFCTGVLQQAYHGAGTIPPAEVVQQHLEALKAGYLAAMYGVTLVAQQPSNDSSASPPPGHPASWQ